MKGKVQFSLPTTGSKYHSRRVYALGKWFDSQREANRFCELSMLEKRGYISNLKTQVPFELVPAQYEPETIGKRGGVKKGKCIEKSVVYYADFVYTEKDGETVVEDSKGVRTDVYKIKKKLMLHVHGIRIREV